MQCSMIKIFKQMGEGGPKELINVFFLIIPIGNGCMNNCKNMLLNKSWLYWLGINLLLSIPVKGNREKKSIHIF